MIEDPIDCVVGIVARKAGVAPKQVTMNTRLLHDLGIDGDDAVETILEISKQCSVDVSEFKTSNYFRSEPSLLSLLRFLGSNKRVEDMPPLTVKDLVNAVRRGKL